MSGFAVRQEEDVLDARGVARVTLVAVLVGLIGVTGAGWLLFCVSGALVPGAVGVRHAAEPPRREIAGIEQTQADTTRDGLDLRARQRAELGRWGWVDRRAGIAKIPIERAMDLVAARGDAR